MFPNVFLCSFLWHRASRLILLGWIETEQALCPKLSCKMERLTETVQTISAECLAYPNQLILWCCLVFHHELLASSAPWVSLKLKYPSGPVARRRISSLSLVWTLSPAKVQGVLIGSLCPQTFAACSHRKLTLHRCMALQQMGIHGVLFDVYNREMLHFWPGWVNRIPPNASFSERTWMVLQPAVWGVAGMLATLVDDNSRGIRERPGTLEVPGPQDVGFIVGEISMG